MTTVHYDLRDLNPALADAWSDYFLGVKNVTISTSDIIAAEGDALVSPANSFGFMDGGLDLEITRRFGWGVQKQLQARIKAEHGGELLVGAALIIPTDDQAIPFVISAPTMRVPQDVSETPNAYLAFRAVLRAVRAHNATHANPIHRVLCPGLGTMTGRMRPEVCAQQMRLAYDRFVAADDWFPESIRLAVRDHQAMRTPRS